MTEDGGVPPGGRKPRKPAAKGGAKQGGGKKKGGDMPGATPGAMLVPEPGSGTAPASISTFIGEPAPPEPGTALAPDTPYTPDASDAPPAENAEGADGVGAAGTDEQGGVDAPAVVSRTPSLKIGLLVGREWSFPPRFIEEVNGRDVGVTAEYVKLGAEHMDDPAEYALIIDRISHEVPFYRTYLKHAVLQGTTVVNNPFMWSADDKFFGASLITKLGVKSPKTVVLPNKDYIPGIIPSESLRNLKYPLDWKELAEYVGMPCILKDAHGGGWKEVYVCRTLDELLHHYNSSGLLTMIVQEYVEWDQFVRCLCVGQDEILPMKYDPRERRYLVEHDHLSPELGARIVRDAKTIVRALGYDMNSIEFAVKDGVPYAIDFMNPAPDMDLYSLTPHYFEWAVTHMADMAVRLAKFPRRQAVDLGWSAMFTSGRAG